MLELREIKCLLALSEQLHFGRTARELYMSQSRVSRTVSEMERKVGGRLFERTSRTVQLTSLGSELIDRLRPLYEQMTDAYEDVVTRADGAEGTVRLGFVATAGGVYATKLMRAAREALPECRVVLREVPCDDALDLLRQGQTDMLIAQLPVHDADMTVGPLIGKESRVLAVPLDHPLAIRDSVSPADIAEETVFRPVGPGSAHREDPRMPWESPSRPGRQRGQDVRTFQEILTLVAAGQGVAPLTESAARYHARPDTVFVPLTGLPDVHMALIWRSVEENRLVRALAACGRRLTEEAALTRAGAAHSH
ncbi:LysR family transcriptional regulator [Streptomyces sp. NPDC048523]|uniref:LysR family transcriptional regulator n=1 Tax=unclassified Streptomyces TaxID=2593676 RepID=UPI00332B42BC